MESLKESPEEIPTVDNILYLKIQDTSLFTAKNWPLLEKIQLEIRKC